jgi:hypothetical protein
VKIALAFSPINPSTALRTSWMLFAAVAALSLLVLPTLFARDAVRLPAPAAQISEARLAQGTEGLLRQTAAHLSKLQGGASVGGFPGFEPPDDDRFKDKIRNQSYGGEEANYWGKEINNFLRQIVDKNPGLTLEQMLQRAGLQPAEIKSYLDALRNVHRTIEGLADYGVNQSTIETLEDLMRVLGVVPWP